VHAEPALDREKGVACEEEFSLVAVLDNDWLCLNRICLRHSIIADCADLFVLGQELERKSRHSSFDFEANYSSLGEIAHRAAEMAFGGIISKVAFCRFTANCLSCV
jgi:hypothetical protein